MKKPALILLAGLLTGCATVRVNGYEIDRKTQIGVAVLGIAAGAAIAAAADDNDAQPKDQSNPGDIVCKLDPTTGECG